MDNFEIFVESGHDVVHLEEPRSNVVCNPLLMRFLCWSADGRRQVSPVKPRLLVFPAADFMMKKLLPKVGKQGPGYASSANWPASGASLIDEYEGNKPCICISLIKDREIFAMCDKH